MADPGWGSISRDLTEFLSDRLQLFFSVKDSFGIGEELGLGALPRLHFPNTWMKIIPLVRPNRFFAFAPPRRLSLDKERKIIVVEPDDALLSVFPTPTDVGSGGGGGFERRFLNIPDEALVGGYAHECAAYQIYMKKIPEEYIQAMKGATDRQRMEDALAAAQGYRSELLCFFETHLELLVYEPRPRYGWIFRGSLSIRDELEDRISFLKGLIE